MCVCVCVVCVWAGAYVCARVCACVCMCVCVCVYVCLSVTAFYLKTIRPILMKLGPHDLNKILRWHFSQILKMLIRWRHSGHFICFRMRHSHGRNFASILFKIIDKKLCCLPMFAIENQQNRSITSGRKSGPRLRKIAFLVFKPVSEVPGSNPGGDENFATWFFLCFWIILIIRKNSDVENDWIYY